MKYLNRILVAGVAIGGLALAGTAKGVVVIDDHFDDGNVATNTVGIGSGFTANVSAVYPEHLPATTVVETGGVVTVTNTSSGVGDFNAVAVTSINSNNAFQFFNAVGATAQFDIAGVTVAAADGGPAPNQYDFSRAYVGLMNADATIGGPHPVGTDSGMNIAVRLFGAGNGGNLFGGATTQGALVLRKGDGGLNDEVEVLSSWNWASFDGTGPLSITMTVDENGYNITFSDGTAAQIGDWAATTTNFTAVDWVGGARAYAHSQIFIEGTDAGASLGMLSLDRVLVTAVPEPASIALMGLGGLMLLRRRK